MGWVGTTSADYDRIRATQSAESRLVDIASGTRRRDGPPVQTTGVSDAIGVAAGAFHSLSASGSDGTTSLSIDYGHDRLYQLTSADSSLDGLTTYDHDPVGKYRTRDVVIVPVILLTMAALVIVPVSFIADWTDPVMWLIAAFGWVPLVLACGRMFFLGIRACVEGVQVRNFWRTFFLEWGEIEQFSAERTPWGWIQAAIHTKSEPDVRYVSGIGHRWLSSVERARRSRTGRIVDELNELLEQQRSAATDTDE